MDQMMPSGLSTGMSFGSLMAALIFGAIGFVAFVHGKRNSDWKEMALGILLMVYPYFVHNTVLLYVIGAVLTGLLFV